jgi:hypothetical protein
VLPKVCIRKRETMVAYCALVWTLVATHAAAFSVAPRSSVGVPSTTRLFMSDPDDKTTLIRSGRKDIAFDQARGRFFETSLNQEECASDDEFCVTDKDTGKLIRLTIEEKERIFLDSLQVSHNLIYVVQCMYLDDAATLPFENVKFSLIFSLL